MAYLKDQVNLIKKKDKNKTIWLTEVLINHLICFCLVIMFKIYNGMDLMKYSE
jgi:hypothetical protein